METVYTGNACSATMQAENLEYTNSHEAETNSTWGEASAHLNKIKEQVWDVLSQYGSFKFKLQVLGLKTDLGQRFNLDKA